MPTPNVTPLDVLNAAKAPIQDFIILQGKRSPGRATITNAGSPRKWDAPGGYGISGSDLIYIGDAPSEFDVIIDIWEKAHWAQWNEFARLLEKRSSGLGAKFLSISHPILFRAPLRISAVAIRDVSQWDQSRSGLWTTRIAMTSWKPPQNGIIGKPDGTIPAEQDDKFPDFANDPVVRRLLDKQSALGGGL